MKTEQTSENISTYIKTHGDTILANFLPGDGKSISRDIGSLNHSLEKWKILPIKYTCSGRDKLIIL